jgi:lysophospholipase L1-like esterase
LSASLLISVLLLETGFRVFSIATIPENSRNIWRHWNFGKFDWRAIKRYYNKRYVYDPVVGYGRADLMDPPPRESGEEPGFTILVLGDSLTEGPSYVPRFRRLVENAFGKGNVRIVNAGVIGYDTELEYRFLKSRGERFAPDLVVLQFCLNDFETTPVILPTGDGNWTALHLGFVSRFIPRRLLSRSRLLQFIALRIMPLLFRARFERSPNEIRRYLHKIENWTRNHGAEFRILLFPFFLPENETDPREAKIRGILDSLGLPPRTVDLSPAFSGYSSETLRANPDDPCHPSRPAHEIAARKLFEALRPLIAKSTPGETSETAG